MLLRESIMRLLKKREEESRREPDTSAPAPAEEKGYENNQPGSKIFVSPLLY